MKFPVAAAALAATVPHVVNGFAVPGLDTTAVANVGFAKCEFAFKGSGNRDTCGGDSRETVTVEKGKDSNGVLRSDDVKFVSINRS